MKIITRRTILLQVPVAKPALRISGFLKLFMGSISVGRKRRAALRKMSRCGQSFRKKHCINLLPGHLGRGHALSTSESAISGSAAAATEMTGLTRMKPEGWTSFQLTMPGAGHIHFAVYKSFQVPSERLNLVQAFRSKFPISVVSAL